MVDQPVSFIERRKKFLEEKAKREGAAPPVPPPVPQPPANFSQDLVPDVLRERTPDEEEMDQIVDSIDIVDAYNKWCGKMVPEVGKKREGVMISCPTPGHADRNPSAWLNLDKQTWFCGGCQEGGDAHDIAAYHFGYPVPGYKDGSSFHKLRQQMAESFGYTFKKVPGGQVIVPPPAEDKVAPAEPEPEPAAQEPKLAAVTPIDIDDDKEELIVLPGIDWRSIVPINTFLYEYMEACTNDDSPEEYHFWHGLLALGHTAGRKVTLDDTHPVFANLLLCLLGGTGTGKSRSRGWLHTVLREVLPYRETGMDTTGVKLVPTPSSGEYLVKSFVYERRDLANPKIIQGYAPVNGIVDFNELSGLLGRSNRQGSTLEATIMQFSDADRNVKIGGLSHGDFVAEDAFCSITATTQPKAIRTLLNKNHSSSGFLNRWVFAGGRPKEKQVLGGERAKYTVDLTAAIDQLKHVRGFASIERKITFEDEAWAKFESWVKTVVHPTMDGDDTDLLQRLNLLVKKIILMLTINNKQDKVTPKTVEAVMSLWQYLIDCYGVVNENIGVTQSSEITQEILRVIRKIESKYGRGASARDIAQYVKRKNYSPDQIKRALETMVALDWIQLEPKKSGGHIGRPTVRYIAVGE